MKKMLALGLLVAAVLSGCTPREKNKLRVKMDVQGFGDTVMVY